MLTLLTLLAITWPAPASTGDTVRIDCGSTQSYRTADGRLFQADQFFTNGQPSSNPSIATIAGTNDAVLYNTERYASATQAPMRYSIPVSTGDYLIRLHFAELYHGATGGPVGSAGQRVFSIILEGRRVVINYDLYAAVGSMTAIVRECRATVTDGFATLDFVPAAGDPTIAALEVLRLPNGTVPQPVCTWTPRANVSRGYKEGQCGLVGSQFYTFGGYFLGQGLEATNITQRYTLATNQWTTLAPMPLATTHTAAAVAGTNIWVVGGYVNNWPGIVTDATQVYDTQTNTWRMGPPMPQRRGAGAAALIGRKLHFFGGVEPDIQTDSPLHFVLDLDNEAAGWHTLAPLPLPRCHLAGASRGGKLYALGGQHGHNQSVTNTNLVHEYDPLTNTWTRRADLPTVRSHFEGTVNVVDGHILTVGGFDSYSNYEDVLSYDPNTNIWSQLCELPEPIGGAFATVLGNTLIVAQGENSSAQGPITTTRTASISRTANTTLSFSHSQLTEQLTAGSTTILPNLLWTLSGSTRYTLNSSTLPNWLSLQPGAATGIVDPIGRDIDLLINTTSLLPGTYNATLQATAPGYTPANATITLTVTGPLANSTSQPLIAASLFPNPASNQTTVQFNSSTTQKVLLEIRNSIGQLIRQTIHAAGIGENRITLATSQLGPGLYSVRVQLQEGVVVTRLLLER